MKKLLADGLASLKLSPPPGALDALVEYSRLLLEQNQVMNLTSITQPSQVAALHFLDSASLLNAASFQNKTVVDIGTGAGFPGLPLRLLEPSIHLTLLDSLGKRIHWLEQVCGTLGVPDVSCLHARAELLALDPAYRDRFDLVVSRAVAPLNLLCELCLPYAAVGGKFLAMKSVDCLEEVRCAENAISRLGGRLLPFYDYTIPGAQITHRIVPIEKCSPTPERFPRRWAKLQKAPL